MISPWFSQLFSSQQAAQEVERRAFCRQEELEARFEDGGDGASAKKTRKKNGRFFHGDGNSMGIILNGEVSICYLCSVRVE